MFRTKRIARCLLGATLAFAVLFFNNEMVDAFSDQVIQKGATGDDVVELQSRLQYVGYYNGKIDGVFGWGTYWAVRHYQYEYGLEIDGLVGDDMKAKLASTTDYDKAFVTKALNEGRKFSHYGGTPKDIQKGPKGSADKQGKQKKEAAKGGEAQQPAPNQPETGNEQEPIIEKANNVPSGYSSNDIQLMAQAVYGEARGEPYEGQVAVAAVIVNRLNSATFPDTVAGVIYEDRAFTAVADGQINLGADETSRQAVLDALNGQDPTNNALYYFNPDTATSGWIWSRPQIKRIGKHIFCY
ncbi:spore cortex-lytic enzyme [Shouchella clausii]|uniref:spore cortex-lytic enzyme n=1 Tax=Shouchella clausii TaxID=79880 RepID=UPI00280BF93D|nr:spore cortex-lytic enzyme [Shouchella clausii]WMM32006.1 spore cortex-lytic enzyme [Shouchella clausii]